MFYAMRGSRTDNRDKYMEGGYYIGSLKKNTAERLADVIEQDKIVRMIASDHNPNYIHNDRIDEEKINKANIFYRPSTQTLELLQEILKTIEVPIASHIGSRWKAVNVRHWSTQQSKESYGANRWHTDGMPNSIRKIMIYPQEVSVLTGTTEIQKKNGENYTVEGEAGTWLLFDNSILLHRGIPPPKGSRHVLEITIAPSFRGGGIAFFAGNNGQYPQFPWQ